MYFLAPMSLMSLTITNPPAVENIYNCPHSPPLPLLYLTLVIFIIQLQIMWPKKTLHGGKWKSKMFMQYKSAPKPRPGKMSCSSYGCSAIWIQAFVFFHAPHTSCMAHEQERNRNTNILYWWYSLCLRCNSYVLSLNTLQAFSKKISKNAL